MAKNTESIGAINQFNARTVKLQEERSAVLLAAKEYGIEMTPETAAEIVAQDAVNNPPCPVCGTPGCICIGEAVAE